MALSKIHTKSMRRSIVIGSSFRSIAGLFITLLVICMLQSSWILNQYTMNQIATLHQQSKIHKVRYFTLLRKETEDRSAAVDVRNGVLPNLTSILQQTLCPLTSPFLDLHWRARRSPIHSSAQLTHHSPNLEESRRIRLWTARLIYAVLFEHQHLPALNEARNETIYNDASWLDGRPSYHCPTSKFLVIALSKNGLGANIRLGAIPALQIGVASDRVVLFLNDVSAGPKFLREPWPLTSCRTRWNDTLSPESNDGGQSDLLRTDHPLNDYQCFFRPISPCTVTEEELNDAHVLKRSELRQLFRSGSVPDSHKDDRVLIAHFPFRPQRQPENLPSRLHERALEWVRRYTMQPAILQIVSPEVLFQAVDSILQDGEDSPVNVFHSAEPTEAPFSYYGTNSIIYQSFLLYALRPNRWATQHLNRILHLMFSQNAFNATGATLGLPIRGSDKCGTESECLSFRQYMEAARESWMNFPKSMPRSSPLSNVVVTTESKQVLIEQSKYASEIALDTDESTSSPIHFITNPFDVTQDTGYVDDLSEESSPTANQIMLSSISSLQLQLHTQFTIGNCCSNFHLLLKDLIGVGCGSHLLHTFQCLQDHSNPAFRICCSWDKSAECIARREIAIERSNEKP